MPEDEGRQTVTVLPLGPTVRRQLAELLAAHPLVKVLVATILEERGQDGGDWRLHIGDAALLPAPPESAG